MDASKPPERVKGMLGPGTSDEFGRFADFEPPVTRSRIESFTVEDAAIVLDGDGSFEAALKRHGGDSAEAKPDAGHGYHRHGLGIKLSEFPTGWSEFDVVELVNGIVDNPAWAVDDASAPGFYLFGRYRDQAATLAIRPYDRWMIAAVIPADLR